MARFWVNLLLNVISPSHEKTISACTFCLYPFPWGPPSGWKQADSRERPAVFFKREILKRIKER